MIWVWKIHLSLYIPSPYLNNYNILLHHLDWRSLIAEFVVIRIQFFVLLLSSLLMNVSFCLANLTHFSLLHHQKTRGCTHTNNYFSTYFIILIMEFMSTDGARAALNLGGTVLGYYPVRVLPSKTAILPVNPTFLPRVWIFSVPLYTWL